MRKRKYSFLWLLICFLLSGCATLNFSSKYYPLPVGWREEIDKSILSLNSKIAFTRAYQYFICKDNKTSTPGIPESDGKNIWLPELLIKYIYQYHYQDRLTIINCIMLHEAAHHEFNLPSQPPEQHYLTDKAVIENFHNTPNEIYSSLLIIQDYWRARKGVGGHLFNIGWNVLNLATLAYAGSGTFVDWFATDISTRINLLRRDYPQAQFIFKRSDKSS